LVDRSPSVVDLLDHRLGAIAARQWRAQGRDVPPELIEEERYASYATLAAPVVVGRVAELCAAPVIVLKGPEVAARYPEPTMRPSHDLDLLVEDAAGAFRALVAAGCKVVGDEPSEHHELPLAFPDLPLIVELHRAPKWPAWAQPPSYEGLLASAVPARGAGEGSLAPAPAHHAVLIAAHSWAHRPLARVLDLLDLQVLLADADAQEAAALARSWGVERIWRTTLAAAGSLFGGQPTPWTLRTWARNTPEVRRPTRGEELVERCLSPFAVLPPHRAVRVSASSVRHMLAARARVHPQRLEDVRPEHPAIVAARERDAA
jgi:hypothetical protein